MKELRFSRVQKSAQEYENRGDTSKCVATPVALRVEKLEEPTDTRQFS
jgi:hypothetical protein